jgi:predicted alpha/beta-fold hydrolase
MAILEDNFRAAPGLWWGHAQSLYGVLGRPRERVATRRERLETPDGDFIDLDRVEGKPGAPTVILLHGLEGSSESGYMQLMLRELKKLEWNGIALNARGCSGEPNRLPASYCSGDYRDLSWLTKRIPGRLFAVGFSLGASVLLNFLAKDEAASRLEAAVAVSAPFELTRGIGFIDSGSWLARQYLARFLPSLKAKAIEKAARFPGLFDPKAIEAVTGIRDFDHLVTAPLFGFSSAEEYYAGCSAAPQLGAIETRTLLLSSSDDALAPPAFETKNPAIDVLITRRGGHVGFVGGSVRNPEFWAEKRLLQWLRERG